MRGGRASKCWGWGCTGRTLGVHRGYTEGALGWGFELIGDGSQPEPAVGQLPDEWGASRPMCEWSTGVSLGIEPLGPMSCELALDIEQVCKRRSAPRLVSHKVRLHGYVHDRDRCTSCE